MKKHKAIVHVPESKNKKIQMIKIWCDLGARLKGNESLSTKIKIHSYCLIATIKKKTKITLQHNWDKVQMINMSLT